MGGQAGEPGEPGHAGAGASGGAGGAGGRGGKGEPEGAGGGGGLGGSGGKGADGLSQRMTTAEDQIALGAHRSRITGTILALLVVGCLLAAVLAVRDTILDDARSERADFALRQAQFQGCVQNGNALREQVRDEFRDLKRDVLIPVFDEVANTITANVSARLILKDAVSHMKHRIKTIERRIPDANCLKAFPPLEGQTYDPDIK